jgi:hypothetical protein
MTICLRRARPIAACSMHAEQALLYLLPGGAIKFTKT